LRADREEGRAASWSREGTIDLTWQARFHASWEASYDRLDGLPTGRASRPVFAWYGDMDLSTHFWRFAQHRGLRATILLHAPVDPARFAGRKALSHAVWQAVADGAARLRQNRPVEAADSVAGIADGPAYA